MQLTRRGLLVLLGGLPLMAAGTIFPALEWVGWGYVGLTLIILLIDWRMAGGMERFEVARHHDGKLSLGVDNPIAIEVENRAARPVAITVRDEPPLPFGVETLLHHGQLPGREKMVFSYTVRPPQRGDFAFGDLFLRWDGPLGLVRRAGRQPAAAAVKVYPNMLEIKRYDLLLRQNRLQALGLRNTRLLGEGTEFERLREYLPDDEYRRINWKATARRQRPITTQYQTERSQNIMTLIDVGRMMQTPVAHMAKLDYVINAVLFLSYVASGVGDRIGMLTFADEVQQFLPPQRGRGQFHRMLESLYGIKPQGVEPDYRRAFGYLAAKQRKRSLVIIFTDLTGRLTIDSLIAHVSLVSRTSLPLVVTISDPDVGEAARQPPADSVDLYRQATAQRLLDQRLIAVEQLRQRGVMVLDTPADTLSIAVINRYLQLKSRELI